MYEYLNELNESIWGIRTCVLRDRDSVNWCLTTFLASKYVFHSFELLVCWQNQVSENKISMIFKRLFKNVFNIFQYQ